MKKSILRRLSLGAVSVSLSATAPVAAAGTFQYDGSAQNAAYGDETAFAYDDEGRIASLTFSGGGEDDAVFSGDMAFAPDARICLSGKGARRLVLNGALTGADTLTLTNMMARTPYEGAFLPKAGNGTAVVFPNANVDDYDIVSTAFDTSSNSGLGTPHYVVRSEGSLEAQLSVVDDWCLKCVKVRLSQSGDDIVGAVVWARYSTAPEDGSVPDFETLTAKSGGTPGVGEYRSRDVASSKSDNGYGIDQLTVSPRNGNATVVLNGKVTGDLQVSPSVDVRVQGDALANWSSKALGAGGRVTFAGPDAASGPVTVSRDETDPPSKTASLFAANQSLAGMEVLSARLGGASISKTGVDAYVAELKNEGDKASVWLQYLNAKNQMQALEAVFTQVGLDVYVTAARRGYITDNTGYGYGVDLDALIAAGTATADTKSIVTDITKSGYCLAGIAVKFPNAAQSVCVDLPGGTTLDGGTFALEGSVACVAASRDSLPTNGFVTVGSGSRLFASYKSGGSSDGLCGGALDISVLSGGSLAITEKYALVASAPVSCEGGEIAIWGFAAGADAQIPLDNLTLKSGAAIRGASFRMGNDPKDGVVQATLRAGGTSPSTAEAPLLLVGKAKGKKEQTVTLDVADTGAADGDLVLAAGIGEFASQRAATRVVKAGAGTVSCGGALNYGLVSSATTVLQEGVWRLAKSSLTHDKLAFTVSGGTLAAAADTANALGVLTVASSGGLSVGEGASLAFADSSGATWATGSDVRLSIAAADGASVRFGTSASGLTAAQLRRVRLNGRRAMLDEQGYLQERMGALVIIR